jgi:hypothetical protein
MPKPFSVPAHRNGLPMPIQPATRPVYAGGPVAVIKRAAQQYLTPQQKQHFQGASEPLLAVLPVNAAQPFPVHPTGALSGISEIRPISVGRKRGLAPGGTQPGVTENAPAGQGQQAPGHGGQGSGRRGGKIGGGGVSL